MYYSAEIMQRIYEATETRTQVGLAEMLGIRQSSISDAKRRGSIPHMWLLKIALDKGIHPEWIMTGKGPHFIVASEDGFEMAPPVKRVPVDELTRNEFLAIACTRLDASDLLELLREACSGWDVELKIKAGRQIDEDSDDG